MNKFSFFFPYHDVSGVPVLFVRLAKSLADRGADVEVIDYPDGYMARTLVARPNLRVVAFADGVPTRVGRDRLLVMQSILPSTIRSELRPDPETNLLFWTLHAMNFVQTIVPSRLGRDIQARHLWITRATGATFMRRFARQMASFVRSLHERGSLMFVDGATYRATCEALGITISDPVFVPTPCPVGPVNPSASAALHSPIAAAWVGRLGDFKVPILLHTLERLSQDARRRQKSVRFTIVGDGPQKGEIYAERFAHEYFSVAYRGTLGAQDLDRFLGQDVDILFAMGTSALEGAKLGVPTVLLDVAYGPVPDGYVFKWLFDSTLFGLGSLIRLQPLEPSNTSLSHIMDALIADRPALSATTHRYCLENHSMDSVLTRFAAAAERASFRAGDVPDALMKKGLVRRVYEWGRGMTAGAATPGARKPQGTRLQ